MSKDKKAREKAALAAAVAVAGLAVADDARHLAAPLFEFRAVHAFGAAGYRGEWVKMKRVGKKFKPYYMVLFQEYVLFYALARGSKPDAHARPLGTAHPEDWLRLDTFNYHLVQTLTERVKKGGLVPKKEVFTNAFAFGADEGELIVECVSPESCEAWAKAIRSRSKDCLKAVKELAGRNAKDVMVEIRVAMPEMPLWKKGPNEETDESVAHWTKSMKEGWTLRAKYLTLARGFALYSQFADYRRYFVWYSTPSTESLNSLEGDLLSAEDAVLGAWRRLFTDRSAVKAKLKTLTLLGAPELHALQKTCDAMLQRLTWYNTFLREVHGSDTQYADDVRKWSSLRAQFRQEEERRAQSAQAAEQLALQQRQQQQQHTVAPSSKSSKLRKKKAVDDDDPFGDVELKHI